METTLSEWTKSTSEEGHTLHPPPQTHTFPLSIPPESPGPPWGWEGSSSPVWYPSQARQTEAQQYTVKDPEWHHS